MSKPPIFLVIRFSGRQTTAHVSDSISEMMELHYPGSAWICIRREVFERLEHFRETVSGCKNVGNFPVLIGDHGKRDRMLCSPIVLYDYPQIAPESAGDF